MRRSIPALRSHPAAPRCLHTSTSGVPTNFTVLTRGSPEQQRADAMLTSGFTWQGGDVSRSQLHEWTRKELLRVQRPSAWVRGEAVLRTRLDGGDALVVHTSLSTHLRPRSMRGDPPSRTTPAWVSHCLLATWSGALLLRKPAGVAAQGGTGIDASSTIDANLPHIQRQLGQADTSHASALRLVHRLDRDVAGLMLIGRGAHAAHVLTTHMHSSSEHATRMARAWSPSRAVAAVSASGRVGHVYATTALTSAPPRIHKAYIALVNAAWPRVLPHEGVLVADVTSSPRELSPARQAASLGATRYVCVDVADAGTVLLLEPLTGRKHQLRQHVRHLFQGMHCIAGDELYTTMKGGEGGGRAHQQLALSSWAVTLPREGVLSQLLASERTYMGTRIQRTLQHVHVLDDLPFSILQRVSSDDLQRVRAAAHTFALASRHTAR